MSSDSAAALANIKDIKTLEANGNVADFDALINACNREISLAITGQSLSNLESLHGTRAQAEVHSDTFNDLIIKDTVSLQHTINASVVQWLAMLNFGNGYNSKIIFDVESYASWEQVTDAIDRGVPISKSALYSKYGLPEPTDDKDAFVYQSGAKGVELSDTISSNDEGFF